MGRKKKVPRPEFPKCANIRCQHPDYQHAFKPFGNFRGTCLVPGCPCGGYETPALKEKEVAA